MQVTPKEDERGVRSAMEGQSGAVEIDFDMNEPPREQEKTPQRKLTPEPQDPGQAQDAGTHTYTHTLGAMTACLRGHLTDTHVTYTQGATQLHRCAVDMHTRVDSGIQRYCWCRKRATGNLRWKSEIRTWEGAGADDGAELLASQAPQEEDDDDPDKAEDEKEPQEEDDDDPAKVEDEEASATEEGESEGKHEGAGADSGAGLPVLQASQEEDDDASDKVQDEEASATEEEESEGDNDRHFGYDPDREVDVCVEYQAAMQDPMFVY